MAGDVEKALSQYREAEAIFKNLGKTDGYEMASLYNNISQIYQEQEEHEKALESLDKALELIKKMENSEAEVATTHVNRALSLMALGRLDEVQEFLFPFHEDQSYQVLLWKEAKDEDSSDEEYSQGMW